jgi:hypothetical protein
MAQSTVSGSNNNTDGRYVFGVSFLARRVGDCVPDEKMKEVAERLVIFARENFESDIVRSESPPQDKTKLWYVPSSKKLYVFDPETSQWEETNVDNVSVCISADSDTALGRDEAGCLLFDPSELAGKSERSDFTITADGSGNATTTLVLTAFQDGEAAVVVSMLTDVGATGRWYIVTQTPTSISITFAGLAAGSEHSGSITAIKS